MLHFGTHWIMGTGTGTDPYSGPYSKMWLLKPKNTLSLDVILLAQRRRTYTYTFYYYWNPTFSEITCSCPCSLKLELIISK